VNKKQYIDALYKGLKWMPEAERREALSDYEAHFAAGASAGKSEEEIAAHLGDPAETIRMFHTESRLATAQETVERAQRSRSAASVMNAILAGIGLGFFNLIIILPVFFSLVAVVISLYAAAVSIAVSGIAVMIGGFVFPAFQFGTDGISAAILFFAGAAILCLGILACVGCWYLSKYFGIGMMKYIQFNIDIVRGRSQKRAMKQPRPAPVKETPKEKAGTSGEGGETKILFGDWMRKGGDALDTAAEKTAEGARKAGQWLSGEWKKTREWWKQFFAKQKEE
jgi:uncharacterized membrane protein